MDYTKAMEIGKDYAFVRFSRKRAYRDCAERYCRGNRLHKAAEICLEAISNDSMSLFDVLELPRGKAVVRIILDLDVNGFFLKTIGGSAENNKEKETYKNVYIKMLEMVWQSSAEGDTDDDLLVSWKAKIAIYEKLFLMALAMLKREYGFD